MDAISRGVTDNNVALGADQVVDLVDPGARSHGEDHVLVHLEEDNNNSHDDKILGSESFTRWIVGATAWHPNIFASPPLESASGLKFF